MLRKPVNEVVVVGGGIIGSSIAYHLSCKGWRNILVLERDFSYKNASAMLSAGGIRQQFSVKENVLMCKYGAEFLKNPSLLYCDNADNDNITDYQFQENGYLFLSSSIAGFSMLQENNQLQRDCGVNWMKLMDPPALRKNFPWLNTDGLTGGSYGTQNEGYFDPWSLLLALKRKAINQGVVYQQGTVVDARMTSDSSHPSIEALLVQTKSSVDEVSGRMFVNACGPWAGKFVDMLAERTNSPAQIHSLPVKARKRSIFMFHCKSSTNASATSPSPQQEEEEDQGRPKDGDGELPAPGVSPLVVDPSGAYFRSEGTDGSFICGISPPTTVSMEDGTRTSVREDQDGAQEDPDPDHVSDAALDNHDHYLFDEHIWPALYERVPAFGSIKLKSSWAGFYEYNTFDQNAIIGHHPDISNLILCNGFSGHGLQQAPAAGRAVAELITDGRYSSIDVSRFSFDRILSSKPVFEQGIV